MNFTVQSLISTIDSLVTGFWAFAKACLSPIAVLCAFFAGVKLVGILFPFVASWTPALFSRGDVMQLSAVAIACALASSRA